MNYSGFQLFSRQLPFENIGDWLSAAAETGAVALIDKEIGWTSFDAVAKMRSLTRIKKVGHAGTLDPLATGLLALCFGSATKSVAQIQELPKKYSATIKLGATTKSDDAEFPEENVVEIKGFTSEEISAALNKFIGDIEQTPPIFSAIKVAGQPLYKAARKGRPTEPPRARIVSIYEIALRKTALPFIEIDVFCGKGTYIRSLARDLGETLGCGGYLTALRRVAIGDFLADDALTMTEMRTILETFKNQTDKRLENRSIANESAIYL